jgi:hypothetical protein
MVTGVKYVNRVEVTTIKYQLSRRPKMKYLLSTLNFSFKCVLPYFLSLQHGICATRPRTLEMANYLTLSNACSGFR